MYLSNSREKELGEGNIADSWPAESLLPSLALSKCFAEIRGNSAKTPIPVVPLPERARPRLHVSPTFFCVVQYYFSTAGSVAQREEKSPNIEIQTTVKSSRKAGERNQCAVSTKTNQLAPSTEALIIWLDRKDFVSGFFI